MAERSASVTAETAPRSRIWRSSSSRVARSKSPTDAASTWRRASAHTASKGLTGEAPMRVPSPSPRRKRFTGEPLPSMSSRSLRRADTEATQQLSTLGVDPAQGDFHGGESGLECLLALVELGFRIVDLMPKRSLLTRGTGVLIVEQSAGAQRSRQEIVELAQDARLAVPQRVSGSPRAWQ